MEERHETVGLIVSTTQGAGPRAATDQVSDWSEAAEIRRALSDYGLGLPIETALERMADRIGLEELSLLAAALAQGKRQGAGMERILRDQETVARMAQRNRAAAEASKVGTRLVGVLVFVYLPEFMLLIIAPLFYGIFLRAFS